MMREAPVTTVEDIGPLGRDYPFHHVSRERELMSARAAHASGFAPAVDYAEPGVMVSRYVGGRTFASEGIRANAGRIAVLMRDFHVRMPHYVAYTHENLARLEVALDHYRAQNGMRRS